MSKKRKRGKTVINWTSPLGAATHADVGREIARAMAPAEIRRDALVYGFFALDQHGQRVDPRVVLAEQRALGQVRG